MYYYRLYGMTVASDLDFPQLVEVQAGSAGGELTDNEGNVEADIVIAAGVISEEVIGKEPEKAYDFGDSRSWLKNKTCYLLVEDGKRITYLLREGGKVMYLRTYILGWGISMLALQRGELAVHCSAVSKNGEAVLIAGESGCGKSTLTTAFLKRGYKLMADDMSIVKYKEKSGAWATSAFPYQKLCRDAAFRCGVPAEELIYIDEEKDKFLVPCRDVFSEEKARIKAMLILCKTGEETVKAKRLQGMELFFACANNLFLRKLLGDRKYEPAIGEKCLKIASCVPMYKIGRPEGKDTLAEVAEQAFKCVRNGQEV